MENQLNNYNLLQIYLESSLTKNIIQPLNQNLQNNQDDFDNLNSQFIQHEKDIYQIYIQSNQIHVLQYSFNQQFIKNQQGHIELIKYATNEQQQQLQCKFYVQQKQGTLIFGLIKNEKLYDLYLGEFTFPKVQLYQFTKPTPPGRISFRNDESQYEIQQIEFHPSIKNLFLILILDQDGQQFNIIQYHQQRLRILFNGKMKNLIQCDTIQFYQDKVNQSIIYFTNILGHLFVINFQTLYQALVGNEFQLQVDNQLNYFKKWFNINYENFEYTVFQKQLIECVEGVCVYFAKLPKDDENFYLFIFQDQNDLTFQLIKFIQNKITRLFKQTFSQILTKNEQFKIQEIVKLQQNQTKINHLYYVVAQKIIHINISDVFQIDFFDLDDPQQEQGNDKSQIIDYYSLDFCYFQYLIIKLQKNNKNCINNYKFLFLNYQIFEQPNLHIKDQYIKKEFETHRKNKEILKNLRLKINQYKHQIKNINSNDDIINFEGKIYNETITILNPIVKQLSIHNEQKDQELCNLLFNIYNKNSDIFKILNSLNYKENMKRIELSQCKIVAFTGQFQIQEKQFENLNKEMKEKIKTNEESIRNEIINSILNMGEDFE